MFNFSNQTKSFIVLILIAFFSAMTAYYLTGTLENAELEQFYETNHIKRSNQKPSSTSPTNKSNTTVDTTNWVTFNDPKFGITFKHPKTWTVKLYKENKADGMYIISLDPGKDSDPIKIYVSNHNYYAMEGLPIQKTTVAGKQALNVADMLVGVKNNSTYYTFDLGGNLKYQPEFKTLVSLVAFGN